MPTIPRRPKAREAVTEARAKTRVSQSWVHTLAAQLYHVTVPVPWSLMMSPPWGCWTLGACVVGHV